MSYSVFAAILWQLLKSRFEQKQSKTDCPKIVWKERKGARGFFGEGSWFYAFQWEKTIENHKCVVARARKVEKLVRFLSSCDPFFPNIWRTRRRCKIYIEIIGIFCKNIESIESMEVTMLESNFCLKGTLIPNNSVQVYDSVEWQKHLILMNWRTNDKITKVAERKLVLGVDFLFTTFSFNLVLTARVFCVALHQTFGTELFHLQIHSLYICGTPHKKVKPTLIAK